MEHKPLHEILKEQMAVKSMTVERLSNATGIPDRFLTSLAEGDIKKLPATPYARGYLLKIAPHLDLNAQELWEIYKNEELKSSGAGDRLPHNRFAIKPVSKKIVFGILAGLLVGAYIVWNLGHLIGQPKLNIVYPVAQTVIVAEPIIRLLGYIDPADKLLINNEEVATRNDGGFEKDFNLEPGLNSIELVTKRFLGKETKAVRQIIYQPK